MPPTIKPPRIAPPLVSGGQRRSGSRRKSGRTGNWKTALVVDPDGDNRKRVVRLLREAAGEAAGEPAEASKDSKDKHRKQRLAVHEADNGNAAWALIEVVKPDLIVAEVLLEGLSGLALLRRLREKYGQQAPVVFFVTDMSNEVDRYWALRNGAGAYVIKPYEDEFLRKRSAKLFDEGDEGGLELDSWPIDS